jgi:hypothetical protein
VVNRDGAIQRRGGCWLLDNVLIGQRGCFSSLCFFFNFIFIATIELVFIGGEGHHVEIHHSHSSLSNLLSP